MMGSAYASVLPEPVGEMAMIDSRGGSGVGDGDVILFGLFRSDFLGLRFDCSFSSNLENSGIVCD